MDKSVDNMIPPPPLSGAEGTEKLKSRGLIRLPSDSVENTEDFVWPSLRRLSAACCCCHMAAIPRSAACRSSANCVKVIGTTIGEPVEDAILRPVCPPLRGDSCDRPGVVIATERLPVRPPLLLSRSRRVLHGSGLGSSSAAASCWYNRPLSCSDSDSDSCDSPDSLQNRSNILDILVRDTFGASDERNDRSTRSEDDSKIRAVVVLCCDGEDATGAVAVGEGDADCSPSYAIRSASVRRQLS